MIQRNNKDYIISKISKNDRFKTLYKNITGIYSHNYGKLDNFILIKDTLYRLENNIKYLNKNDIISIYGFEFFKSLKNKYINFSNGKINFIGLSNIDSNFIFHKNNIDFFNIEDNIKKIYNSRIFFKINGIEETLLVSKIFKNENEFYLFINNLKDENYHSFIKLILLGNFNITYFNLILKSIFLLENNIKFNNNFLDISSNLDGEYFLNKIELFLRYKVILEKNKKVVELTKQEVVFLKKNGILDNIIEGKIYNGNEFYSIINKKNKNWNKIDKYYTTAPKWYRKIENKRLKNINKKDIIKKLNIGDIDNISNIKYVKNGSWYY